MDFKTIHFEMNSRLNGSFIHCSFSLFLFLYLSIRKIHFEVCEKCGRKKRRILLWAQCAHCLLCHNLILWSTFMNVKYTQRRNQIHNDVMKTSLLCVHLQKQMKSQDNFVHRNVNSTSKQHNFWSLWLFREKVGEKKTHFFEMTFSFYYFTIE